MPRGCRLALLTLALSAPLLGLSASAGAAGGSCTTAFLTADHPTGELFGTGCSNAILTATPNPVDPNAVDPTVTLDGSESSGPDGSAGSIAAYAWDFGDTTTDETVAATTTHVFPGRGSYGATLTLKGTGDEDLAVSQTVQIIVSAMPTAVLSAPSGVLRPGVAYDFDATGSAAPGGTIDHYVWNWGDGTTSQTVGPLTQHTFADDGASTSVSVRVVNDLDLASAPASQSVLVDNLNPVVQLVATPASVGIGEHLTLDAAGSVDPDGTIAEYRWDLNGDGVYEHSTGTVSNVSAGGFPNPGIVVLGVKVIDDSNDFTVKRIGIVVTGSGGASNGDSGAGGGTGGNGGSGGSGAQGSGSAGGSGFVLGLTGTTIQKLAAALKRGVGLRATSNRTANGKLTLTVTARDAKTLKLPGRHGRKPVTIGTLRVSLRAGKAAKASVKLTRKAGKALRHARPSTLRITVTGALSAGGARAKAARVVLLRG